MSKMYEDNDNKYSKEKHYLKTSNKLAIHSFCNSVILCVDRESIFPISFVPMIMNEYVQNFVI